MIFQDPLSSLHPYYTVGWQIVEMIRLHDHDMSKDQAMKRAVELLRLVGIPQPDRRVDDYPHQFSGGMRQRAMIAMAMALNPALLIADEPTTALDVTVQAQVLRVIRRMQEVFGTAVILITHDLGVVADVADEVLVMYGGKVMERADRRTLFFASHHPYTEGLLQSMPSYGGERGRLRPIAGQPPSLLAPPPGCPFAPRCVYVMDKCAEMPSLDPVGAGTRGTSRPAGCRTTRPTVRPSGAGWRTSSWPSRPDQREREDENGNRSCERNQPGTRRGCGRRR